MSLEEKKAQLAGSKQFHDENSDRIRFDPNVPKTVIFPADWHKYVTSEERTFAKDGADRTVTYTIYQVYNPNASDPKKLRTISATSTLNDEISNVLEDSIEEGWDGPIIANITKELKMGQQYGKWKVRADKYKEPQGEGEVT